MHPSAIALFAIVVASSVPVRAQQSVAPERVSLIAGEPFEAPPCPDHSCVRRARAVELDSSALAAVVRREHERGTRLVFEAFPDQPLELQVERTSLGWSGATIIAGRLAGIPRSSFTLATDGRHAAGYLRRPGQPVLALRGMPGGQWIAELETASLPTCGASCARVGALNRQARAEAERLSPALLAPPPAVPVAGPVAGPGAPPTEALGSNRFDVLVLYTQRVQDDAGGAVPLTLEIEVAVDEGDQAFADSNVAADLLLVGVMKVDHSETNTTHDQHLFALSNPFDGVLDEVQGWRNVTGADMVSLLLDDSDGGELCGLGYILPAQPLPFVPLTGPYSTVNYPCLAGFTLIHEFGHNMGCTHDFANADIDLPDVGIDLPPIPSTEDAYGWRFVGDSGVQWRTIMAYAPGERIGHFSNPAVDFDGRPTGLATGPFVAGADNAGAINANASVIAGFGVFQPKATPVHVDLSASPLFENGTAFAPFDTLQEALLRVQNGGLLLVRGSGGSTPPIAQSVLVDGWTSSAVLEQ